MEERSESADVAMITGGGTGLGLEIARVLSDQGYRIAIASRDSTHLSSVRRTVGRSWIQAGRPGVILNVVATYAWTGGPGTVHSAAAKAGVLALTRTLAVEWARHGIRVVAIAPGAFESTGAADRLWPTEELKERVRRSIPLGRFAKREEIAKAAA